MKTFFAVLFANLLTVALVAFCWVQFSPTVRVETPERQQEKQQQATASAERAKKPAKVVMTRDAKRYTSPFTVHAGTSFPYLGSYGDRYRITVDGAEDSVAIADAELRTASGEPVP